MHRRQEQVSPFGTWILLTFEEPIGTSVPTGSSGTLAE
jgi:hypothetical protein